MISKKEQDFLDEAAAMKEKMHKEDVAVPEEVKEEEKGESKEEVKPAKEDKKKKKGRYS